MTDPYFPVNMNAMRARRTFSEIKESPLKVKDFTVHARQVHHPQGCLCFRIENNGKAAVYATDIEPGNPSSDKTVRDLARGAELLIYDAQYSRQQIDREKRGWGHSTWEDGVLVIQEVGVKELILFHHDPDNDDVAIDRMQESARARFPNTRSAFEGMEIVL
jgi:ribonuclease BN (tRNA processing enzyme)